MNSENSRKMALANFLEFFYFGINHTTFTGSP